MVSLPFSRRSVSIAFNLSSISSSLRGPGLSAANAATASVYSFACISTVPDRSDQTYKVQRYQTAQTNE